MSTKVRNNSNSLVTVPGSGTTVPVSDSAVPLADPLTTDALYVELTVHNGDVWYTLDGTDPDPSTGKGVKIAYDSDPQQFQREDAEAMRLIRDSADAIVYFEAKQFAS